MSHFSTGAASGKALRQASALPGALHTNHTAPARRACFAPHFLAARPRLPNPRIARLNDMPAACTGPANWPASPWIPITELQILS